MGPGSPVYDVPAEGYEELYGREQLEKYELLALNIEGFLTKVETVLDVGCATCLFGDYLRSIGYQGLYIGIDIDLERLRIAKRKLSGGFMLIQADAHHLPIRENAIDFAASITVIHLLDLEKALSEMFRAARKLVVITLLKKRSNLKPKLLKALSRLSRIWLLKIISVQRVGDEIAILKSMKRID